MSEWHLELQEPLSKFPCFLYYFKKKSKSKFLTFWLMLIRYLHEVCEPPIIHRNFKSANVLLDDDLNVLVSDCGLAPLISSGSVSQVSS